VQELQPTSLTTTQTREFLSGTIAGRFVIGARLGKGGMGEVYRAEDSKLKRIVALKRLAPHLRADPLYRRRFQEEAQHVSRFSDPHIASVYDVLEDRGEIFLVMEYVEGQTLRDRLRSRVTLDEFLDIAIQCAQALIAAHERGIVHCDIKPENIMLTNSGQVKILDFGIGKHLPRSDQSSTIDRSGSLAGTPAYMAPEVLLEKCPDGRADIFSLGIVFYEALTGHHPFLADTFVGTIDRIRHETPAPMRIFNSKVPEQLEAVVGKAVAKDPSQRYPNARDLLQDLRLVQSNLTAAKLQILPHLQARKSSRLAVAAIVSLLVLAGIFAVYRKAHSEPILHERGWVLISDFGTRGDDPFPDMGVREGLTIALQQSRYVNVFPRTRAYDVLQRMKKGDVARIDENLGREICQRENLQVLLSGSIEHIGQVFQITVQAIEPTNGNMLFAERERFDRKEQFFEKADDLAKKVRKDLGESLAKIEDTSRSLAKVTTSSLEALQLYSQAKDAKDHGRWEEALTPLQGALRLDPNFAMAHVELGNYYAAIVGKNEKAVAEFQRAYDLRQGVTDRERLWIEANYFSLQERYEDAVQSLAVLVSLYPDDLDSHLTLANAYDNVARPDKTIAELREVLRLNPQALAASGFLVVYLARSNANDQAIGVYNEARQRGLDSPQLHRGLGLAYLGLGRLGEARDEFRKVERSGQPYQDLGQFYLARTDIYEGKLSAARAHLAAILQRDESTHTKGLQPESHNLLGRIYIAEGQPILARHQAEQILAAPEPDLQLFDLVSAGILYARSGDLAPSLRILHRLERASHETPTASNKSFLLSLQGEIAIAEQQAAQAATAFRAADDVYPEAANHIGLARAYEAQREWRSAIEEWQHVLSGRGEILEQAFPADLVLAHLYLARNYVRMGDISAAREQFVEFLQLWQQSDDLREKRQAKSELKMAIEQSKKQVLLHKTND